MKPQLVREKPKNPMFRVLPAVGRLLACTRKLAPSAGRFRGARTGVPLLPGQPTPKVLAAAAGTPDQVVPSNVHVSFSDELPSQPPNSRHRAMDVS